MNELTKLKIRSGLLSGLIFALIMAGFDWYNEERFSVIKFLLYASVFGFFMGLIAKDRSKKDLE